MQTRRVLIIDDCPEDREAYKRYLTEDKSYQYSFCEADVAETGLSCFERESIDAILLDYHLPDLDGLEFLGNVNPHGKSAVPVIILTGQGSEAVAVEAMKKGAQDYLRKGDLTGEQLRQALAKAIEFVKRERLHDTHMNELERLAFTDELTGLHNRRHLMRKLSEELAIVHRYGSPLSLALLDLDHFKNINDTFGHASGDEILKAFAGTVRANSRLTDVPARYGGEEFCIVMPATDGPGATMLAERLCNDTRQLEVTIANGTQQRITCSVGLSDCSNGVASASELLDRADRALYEAKARGRDCVQVWSPELEGRPEAVDRVRARRSPDC